MTGPGVPDATLLDAVFSAPAPVTAQAAAVEAWRELVQRHSGAMFAVGRALGLDPQTAEDLVQTAWLRLLERGGQLRDTGALRPWLCAIVRNEGLKLLTRRRELPSDTTTIDVRDHGGELSDRLIADERAHALRQAFARLDEPCRQLLRLTTMDPPMSYDEIAVTLGRPRGSLGPTRRRCLQRLRTLLPAGFGDDDEVSSAGSAGPARGGTAEMEGRYP